MKKAITLLVLSWISLPVLGQAGSYELSSNVAIWGFQNFNVKLQYNTKPKVGYGLTLGVLPTYTIPENVDFFGGDQYSTIYAVVERRFYSGAGGDIHRGWFVGPYAKFNQSTFIPERYEGAPIQDFSIALGGVIGYTIKGENSPLFVEPFIGAGLYLDQQLFQYDGGAAGNNIVQLRGGISLGYRWK